MVDRDGGRVSDPSRLGMIGIGIEDREGAGVLSAPFKSGTRYVTYKVVSGSRSFQ